MSYFGLFFERMERGQKEKKKFGGDVSCYRQREAIYQNKKSIVFYVTPHKIKKENQIK